MADRMDIMKIEPTADVERLLATVVLTDEGTISVQPAMHDSEPEYWLGLLSDIADVDPEAHPRDFFDAVRERLDGTYVYAREPDPSEDQGARDMPHTARI